jgi:hypothetical protein
VKVGWSGEKKSEWDEAARAERDDWGKEVSGGGGWQKEIEDWRRKEKRRHEETMQGEGGGNRGPFHSHGSEGVAMVGTGVETLQSLPRWVQAWGESA